MMAWGGGHMCGEGSSTCMCVMAVCVGSVCECGGRWMGGWVVGVRVSRGGSGGVLGRAVVCGAVECVGMGVGL